MHVFRHFQTKKDAPVPMHKMHDAHYAQNACMHAQNQASIWDPIWTESGQNLAKTDETHQKNNKKDDILDQIWKTTYQKQQESSKNQQTSRQNLAKTDEKQQKNNKNSSKSINNAAKIRKSSQKTRQIAERQQKCSKNAQKTA